MQNSCGRQVSRQQATSIGQNGTCFDDRQAEKGDGPHTMECLQIKIEAKLEINSLKIRVTKIVLKNDFAVILCMKQKLETDSKKKYTCVLDWYKERYSQQVIILVL